MARAAIKVEGLDKTLRALSVIDPEAMKALRRGFRKASGSIIDKAKRNAPDRPLRNYGRWKAWSDGRDLSWDANKVRRGMTTQVSTGRRNAGLRLLSKNPAAAIWENAGSTGEMRTTRADRVSQSRAFNRLANAESEAPRLLVKTWKEEKGVKQTYVAVTQLIRDAEDRVQAAMR